MQESRMKFLTIAAIAALASTPVLADPNNRLSNYTATLNEGALTITAGSTGTTGDITWPTPAPIVYGTTLTAAQLDATSTKPGTFSYTPPAGTVLGAFIRMIMKLRRDTQALPLRVRST